MRNDRLSLRKEVLGELCGEQLALVAAGQAMPSLPINQCLLSLDPCNGYTRYCIDIKTSTL